MVYNINDFKPIIVDGIAYWTPAQIYKLIDINQDDLNKFYNSKYCKIEQPWDFIIVDNNTYLFRENGVKNIMKYFMGDKYLDKWFWLVSYDSHDEDDEIFTD